MDLLFGSGSFRILHNTGNGSLTLSSELTDTDGSLVSNGNIGFAKINNDDLLDWIYTISVNSTFEIRYQLQNPDGSFGNKSTIVGTSYTSNKRLGDFNGDGKTDIIYSTFINNANIYVMIKNLGGGNFEVGSPVATDLYVYINPINSNPVGDFNNDGKDDILSRGAVFYGQADGTFNRTQLSGTSDTLLTAELNGDNNLDIVEIGSDFYAAHINKGLSGFSRTLYQKSIGIPNNWRFEDFSGDGKADLFDARTISTNYNYNIFGERLISIRENICQSFGETKQVNFDGNENADVAMWNPNTGDWLSKNAKWFPDVDPNTRVFNWGSGALGDVPAPGDFDGDGQTDYSVYRNSTGVWYIFKSSDSSWLTFQFGLTGDIAVPNDYDGGGKTDIAVFRPEDGNWYVWFSETQQFQALHFGASGDKPVPADYDGDGKTDVAVYRPASGNWYYLKSSDGNFAVYHWGIETDKPVPADYDGDGRADLAIYRDGIWWFLRSSDNSSVAIGWGAAGDIPIPVYRNSISADLVFYRPSNNLWHSLDYRDGPGFTLGENQDVPVYFGLPNN
ncbi:MAG: VCBS repeat-containing protein [Pyrinomonadaceae bacterium]